MIRIDQANQNERMEINGKEITSGENGTIEIRGIKLEWLIEYGDKGYYITIK